MEYKHIIYQPGRIARIILNRPRYMNAQSRLMREEMDDAFVRATNDDEVCVIILSGAGESFSAGHDIGTTEDLADRKARGLPKDRLGRYRDMRADCLENTMRWRNVPKPTIAMVHGYCIFGGWMFATAMDLLFASEDAMFLPSHFQYFSTPWDIGPKKAKEILFEHRFISAWEAYDLGFINRVFPKAKLEEETLTYAQRVAENYAREPFRVRTMKFSINHMLDTMGFTTALEAAYQSYCVMMGLEERQLPAVSRGGLSMTPTALHNLELTKPWLEAARRHK
jgi:enoyl-CoA hydratase